MKDDLIGRALEAIEAIRAANAGNLAREGREWSAYDMACIDCHRAIAALRAMP